MSNIKKPKIAIPSGMKVEIIDGEPTYKTAAPDGWVNKLTGPAVRDMLSRTIWAGVCNPQHPVNQSCKEHQSCLSYNTLNRVQTFFHGMTQSVLPQYKKCHAMEYIFVPETCTS